jgi:hypothetical protein
MKRVSATLAVLLALGALGYVGVYTGLLPAGRLDRVELQATIREDLNARLDATVSVSCPETIRKQKGLIIDCQMRRLDNKATSLVRVTQDDHRGHYTYEVARPLALLTEPAPAPGRAAQRSPGRSLSEASGECTPAAPGLLSRVEASPDESVDVLDLPHGRVVPAPGGVVLLAQADFEDEYGVRDPVLGEWFVANDGTITSFDDVAEGVSGWPRHRYDGITTGTTMVVADCASQIELQ